MATKAPKTVAQNIRDFREDKDLTQADLAWQALGRQRDTIRRMETGKTSPIIEDLEMIAQVLGKKIEDFFNTDEITTDIDAFIDIFGQIRFSKEVPVSDNGIIKIDNLQLSMNRECLVLQAPKHIFSLLHEIGKAQSDVRKIKDLERREKCYQQALQELKTKYRKIRKNKLFLKKESYFLVSKDELSDIIEKGIRAGLTLSMNQQ